MFAADEYMAFLQQNPEFYRFVTKTKLVMRMVKTLEQEGELMKKYSGRADCALIAKVLKEELGLAV